MKLKSIAAAAAMSTALFASTASFAEDLYFNLVNFSSGNLVGFHVSHTGTRRWEENLLEGAYLPPGNEIEVAILDGRLVCEYDIRAVFDDGGSFDDYDIDLCELGEYTLHDE